MQVAGPFYRKGGEWKPLPEDMQSHLAEVLLSENLIVLSGLGTSLCVTGEDGKRKAPTMWDLWTAITEDRQDIAEIMELVRYKAEAGKENVETLLSHCQLFLALYPNHEQVDSFMHDAEEWIRQSCGFVSEQDDLSTHEQFLLKVARRSIRQPRMRLFTTNYDRCFEEAATRTRFIVIDGFTHTIPQEFDGTQFSYDFVRRENDREVPDYIPNVFHLYKLHGSVDWDVIGKKVVRSPKAERPAMIYPRQAKYELSYHQPYFEMMSRFQSALRQPNTGLLIIGFGFNDDHLSEPIRAAIASNVGLKCCVVTPGFLDENQSESLRYITRLIDSGDRRLHAIAGRFEEFVPRIPDLVATTEQEQHRDRIARNKR
jgi:hypothetical protein